MTETCEESLAQIGNRLIELRKEKGYRSHETFAMEFDLPRVQYWRMEKGRCNFTLKSLTRVLTIHGLSVTDFFASMKK